MALNKIQNKNSRKPGSHTLAQINQTLRNTPDDVMEILVEQARCMLDRLDIPKQQAEIHLRELREERNFQYFLRLIRLKDLLQECSAIEREIEKAPKLSFAKSIELKERLIKAFVLFLCEDIPDHEKARRCLMDAFFLDEQTAEEKLGDNWP